MRRSVSGWVESGRAVGAALLEVWQAEVDALRSDFARTRRELRGVLIAAVLAGALCFWTVGLGLWAVVEGLATRWPRWVAVTSVFAAGVVVTLLIAWLTARRARRLEPPLETVRRRGREHLEWWQESVLPDIAPPMRSRPGPEREDDETEPG